MRLLALPVLAIVALGSGAALEPVGETAIAHSARVTLGAGSARFAVSYSGTALDAGAIDLGDETAVLDRRGDIFGAHAHYQRIPRREAAVLGIPEKQWIETETEGGFWLVGDPWVTGNRTRGFFELLGRADHIRALGRGEERGSLVQRYSGKLQMDDFLAGLPPFEKETGTSKPGDGGPTSWRDYLGNYFVWDDGGQTVELAVDSRGRIRRARVELGIEPVTVELYDYGVPVDVTPPPAKQVLPSTVYENLKSKYCSDPSRQTLPRPYPC